MRRRLDSKEVGLNWLLALGIVAVHAFLLFGLPRLLSVSGWWWAGALVLFVVLPMPMWIATHEAVHGSLAGTRRSNDWLGRLLATVCYGAPFELLRIGHLLHHQDSAYGQPTLDPAARRSSRRYLHYYAGLLLQPVAPLLLSNVLAVLPKRWVASRARALASPALLARVLRPHVHARIRAEGMVTLAVFGLAVHCWREHLIGLMCMLALRCVIISFDDSVYHYQGPRDPRHGYNLHVPRALAPLFLGFNRHGVHHLNPGLAWRQLEPVFARARFDYDGRYFSVAAQQLRPWRRLVLPLCQDR